VFPPKLSGAVLGGGPLGEAAGVVLLALPGAMMGMGRENIPYISRKTIGFRSS